MGIGEYDWGFFFSGFLLVLFNEKVMVSNWCVCESFIWKFSCIKFPEDWGSEKKRSQNSGRLRATQLNRFNYWSI